MGTTQKIPASYIQKWLFPIFLTVFSILSVNGQQDTIKKFKNTIRYNITNPVLFDFKFAILGYERVINDHQSFSINIGRTYLPGSSFLSDSLKLEDQFNEKGFNFSLDYRFYLRKENKNNAPRGVYIGPYYAFNSFSRDLTWNLNTDDFTGMVEMGYRINANFLGAQLGYQFIFWNRLTLDMVLMGPGLWNFNFKSHFDTNLSAEDETMLLEELNKMIQDKFPGTDFMIKGTGFESSKTSSTSTVGLRYMINIGFRF
jgi:hypothetical protein